MLTCSFLLQPFSAAGGDQNIIDMDPIQEEVVTDMDNTDNLQLFLEDDSIVETNVQEIIGTDHDEGHIGGTISSIDDTETEEDSETGK